MIAALAIDRDAAAGLSEPTAEGAAGVAKGATHFKSLGSVEPDSS
jgi:hypothetical protein